MADAPSPVQVIRNRTTDSVQALPAEKIHEFLAQYQDNVDLATAEALEYLARKVGYDSVTRGNISVSGPTLRTRATFWREKGERALAETLMETTMRTATMSRGDLHEGTTTPEYGSAHVYCHEVMGILS